MLLATFALAAAQPAALTPTGPWNVRMDEDMCLLERAYLAPGGKASLTFQPLLDLDEMEMYVRTPAQSGARRQGTFRAEVAPAGRTFKGEYVSVIVPNSNTRLTRLISERALLDGLADGDTVRVKAGPVEHGFVVRHPEKARAVLRECVDKLKRAWGIDPDLDARAVSKLEGNPGRYFGPENFPAEALRNGAYGRVVALLNITAQGTVEKCRIVQSAGETLNAGTCRAAMKIRFTPPRDATGAPLPSTYLLPVRWSIGGAGL